jgi:gamma-glutamylcyclotransferase (GGCT)/AIG2-like uncharacterized protein YtfP
LHESRLFQNYPNPFTESTFIEYQVKTPGAIEVSIFNVEGKLVKEWNYFEQSTDKNRLEWDCKNDLGHEITSGIYFYRLRTENFSDIKSLVLMR